MAEQQDIAKSQIIFDIKVYEVDQDLQALANKIFDEVKFDGLVWVQEYKILPIAYGLNKLIIYCQIQDDKVSSEDIINKITSWQDVVQSVDILAIQKI